MRLAIVHYHLNRGGVTQVILNHMRALSSVQSDSEPMQVVVFYGGRKEAWRDDAVAALGGLDVSLEALPELEYDSQPIADPDRLANCLTAALSKHGMCADETLVHIHNHALGKNRSLPGAVARLGQTGFAVLLQIHDFAEDFRPTNYRVMVDALARDDPRQLAGRIYPQGSAIHYAVLNGRDYKILATAGVDCQRLHPLPNPVSDFGTLPDRVTVRRKLTKLFAVPEDQPYVLYPVRGIRRKNLGEMLLWGAARSDQARFALTLPPLNPAERTRYNAWKQLANELALPVLFDVGADGAMEFGENLAAADQMLTTSVAEGFGMVFLETWLAGLSLIGRDLPEITADFVASGVEFPHLRAQVNVPIDWIGANVFESEMRESYRAVLDAYHLPIPDSQQFHRDVSGLFPDGLLDFAHCSARLQALIVSQVARSQQYREALWQWNPGMGASLDQRPDSLHYITAANAKAVRDNYCIESSGMRLQKLYRSVLESPRGYSRDLQGGSTILDAFLSLSRFNPIRID